MYCFDQEEMKYITTNTNTNTNNNTITIHTVMAAVSVGCLLLVV